MGRYKEYREPKRRGYDDDFTPQDRPAEGRPSNSRPNASQASEAVDAIVKLRPGADRIAANGDTANKIGTYSLAVLARHHEIAFQIEEIKRRAEPFSTVAARFFP